MKEPIEENTAGFFAVQVPEIETLVGSSKPDKMCWMLKFLAYVGFKQRVKQCLFYLTQ
jgi:hypothetical protein